MWLKRRAITAWYRLLPWMPDDSAELEADRSWYYKFKPATGVSYATIYEYAGRKYAEELAHFDALDQKAGNLFQLSALLAGLVATAAHHFQLQHSTSVRFAFAMMLAGMIVASIARAPVLQHSPARVRELMEHAADPGLASDKLTDDQRKAWLAASMHCAIAATRRASEWKADKLSLGTGLVCVGIGLLFGLFQ